jgi:hypothetical protein
VADDWEKPCLQHAELHHRVPTSAILTDGWTG